MTTRIDRTPTRPEPSRRRTHRIIHLWEVLTPIFKFPPQDPGGPADHHRTVPKPDASPSSSTVLAGVFPLRKDIDTDSERPSLSFAALTSSAGSGSANCSPRRAASFCPRRPLGGDCRGGARRPRHAAIIIVADYVQVIQLAIEGARAHPPGRDSPEARFRIQSLKISCAPH